MGVTSLDRDQISSYAAHIQLNKVNHVKLEYKPIKLGIQNKSPSCCFNVTTRLSISHHSVDPGPPRP